MVSIVSFSEEESGQGSWPETGDRQTMVKEVNRILSAFQDIILLSYKSVD